MEPDFIRLFLLEARVKEIQHQLAQEHTELKDIKITQTNINRLLTKAETWVRTMLWAGITLGGAATQYSEKITTWLNQ